MTCGWEGGWTDSRDKGTMDMGVERMTDMRDGGGEEMDEGKKERYETRRNVRRTELQRTKDLG